MSFKNGKTVVTSSENKQEDDKNKVINNNATFEEAVTITGFGKFNIFLLLITVPANMASVFETTTMSYVLASAKCDLNLSLEDKGYLNSITYAGMILSGPLWGFLIDTLGRKRLLVYGLLLDSLFVFLCSFSQELVPLMVFKFLGGAIVNGPFSAMSSYLSEFHCAKYRPRIQMVIGTVNSMGMLVLPLIAWGVLPQQWNLSFFGILEMHSWNIYLLLCGFPALISGLVFLFLPESPKFLMTIGENKKALEVFRKVYSLNTGKPKESFPITQLVDETKEQNGSKHGGQVTANRTTTQALKEGWQQITPLFYPPYLSKLLLVCVIQIFQVQSLNTLRLWLPQIFQAMDDYSHNHNGTTSNLCTMLEELKPPLANETITECSVNIDNSSVYINSTIIAGTTVIAYSLTGTIITLLGKKKILIFLGILSGIASISLILSQNSITTTILSSCFIALGSVNVNVLLSVIVDLFPTTLRTLTLSLCMCVARTGAMVGNILFPILLKTSCESPFFYVGGLVLGSSLICILLPNTENKALK